MENCNLNVIGKKGEMSEIPEFDLRAALKWDTEKICDSQAIYMLKGWEYSSGAKAEHALAVALQHQIIYEQ